MDKGLAAQKKAEALKEFHDAVSKNDPEEVRKLVKKNPGFDLNAWDEYGKTALFNSSYKGNLTMVRALLKLAANPDAPNQDGITPLGHFISSGNSSIIKALLDAGAKPNALDSRGNPVLCVAVHRNDLTTVKALLDAGANLEMVGANRQTALQIAKQSGNKEIIDAIEKHPKTKRSILDNLKNSFSNLEPDAPPISAMPTDIANFQMIANIPGIKPERLLFNPTENGAAGSGLSARAQTTMGKLFNQSSPPPSRG